MTHADQAMAPQQQHAADVPTPAKPYKPCNGPRCSHAPTVPLIPAPTVVPPAPQEWGWLAGVPDFTAPGRGALLFECSPQHPIRLAGSIFHPPRFAA